ncbi:transglycosylase family protein [Streptomyces sp. NPDC001744]|uniref:transglycosylase family protein n=1 Tax=Streptomyces sp. NPDC001744 TaxID=3364606 RepID=UPI00368BE477
MRSGNGRHRRPRQAPALVVAAGVTGSAMALPLLATGSASAADAATWDRVAECESGGQWSANTGNGMYGGLQFTQESWERHGGLVYAPSPDLASRAQQIAVAEKALAKGGVEWATCAPIAGLANDGKATGVDPGPVTVPGSPVKPVPESGWNAGGSGAPTATPETVAPEAAERPAPPAVTVTPATPVTPASPTAPATPVAPVPPSTPGAPTGTTAPTAPVTPAVPDTSVTPVTPVTPEGGEVTVMPGTGKHRGGADLQESIKSGTSVESGRHASGEDKLAENPAGTPVTDGVENSGVTDGQGSSGEYVVRPGDSLSDIARANELPGGWTALYDANKRTVGTDPDLILPGQNLELTPAPNPAAG